MLDSVALLEEELLEDVLVEEEPLAEDEEWPSAVSAADEDEVGADVDVFESLSEEDYNSFYDTVKKYAPIARKALEAPDISESVRLWREFFCGSEEFPTYRGGFSPRTQKTEAVPTGRFG